VRATKRGLLFCFSFFKVCSYVVAGQSKLTNEEVRKKRTQLFSKEKERQSALITRVEKIEVKYTGPLEQCTLVMNKNLSTPHDCARRKLSDLLISEISGQFCLIYPSNDSLYIGLCNILLNNACNVLQAFWRTGSFLLGYIVEHAFKDNFYVQLHSWPQPQVRSGSFVYNIDLNIENWQPREDELHVLSGMGRRLTAGGHRFERLEVDASLALKIFEDNKYKVEQIPRIASMSATGNSVTLYRLLDHVDISSGPMIGSLDQIWRFKVVAVHPIETSLGVMYRFQGLAIPNEFTMSEFAFNVCCDRARKMVSFRVSLQKLC
ncbi:39S ribosomal protein L39, putative, partial [Ixodes scapularis]